MEERKACVKEKKLARSEVLRLLFFILGFISLGLGTVDVLKDGKEAKHLMLQHS